MRVLVLGGYGTFGAPISRALAAIPGIEVIVAGRDACRARALADALGCESCVLDAWSAGLHASLGRLRLDWVVSAAGPFQGAGYTVASACIQARVGYVDIADGRDFVCGIAALDAAARDGGVVVVSGASSVPALSGAVVDRYAPEFTRLDSIDIGIAASSRLPGRATVIGALGQCGRPMRVWRDGGWQLAYGWQRPRLHRFALGPMTRWIADCDVPDLDLLPQRHPGLRSVQFGAGAGSAAAQLALFAASGWGRVAPLPALARGALHAAGRLAEALGPARSGMFVRLAGLGAGGAPLAVTWELVADDHRGRLVPCMGVVAMLRKALLGMAPPAGARPCVGLLSLDEYLAELRGLPVATGVSRHEGPPPGSLSPAQPPGLRRPGVGP